MPCPAGDGVGGGGKRPPSAGNTRTGAMSESPPALLSTDCTYGMNSNDAFCTTRTPHQHALHQLAKLDRKMP